MKRQKSASRGALARASEALHSTNNRQIIFYGGFVKLLTLGVDKCSKAVGESTTIIPYDSLLVRETGALSVMAGIQTTCIENGEEPARVGLEIDLVVFKPEKQEPQGRRLDKVQFMTGDDDCDETIDTLHASDTIATYVLAQVSAAGPFGAAGHGTTDTGRVFLGDLQRFIDDGAQSI